MVGDLEATFPLARSTPVGDTPPPRTGVGDVSDIIRSKPMARVIFGVGRNTSRVQGLATRSASQGERTKRAVIRRRTRSRFSGVAPMGGAVSAIR